jgi:pyrimidine operon attenuation protein / uracil phosphoribosyltransferase
MIAQAQSPHVVLMDADRIERSIRRMAFNLAEEYHDRQILLLGLNARGHAVATRLHAILASILHQGCDIARLDIESEDGTTIPEGVHFDGKTVIIVDDVIFSGRTMQKAVALVIQYGAAGILQSVVLVDRGHRKFPVEPQFSGLTCPTKLREHVHVDLIPDAKQDQVILVHDAEHFLSQ